MTIYTISKEKIICQIDLENSDIFKGAIISSYYIIRMLICICEHIFIPFYKLTNIWIEQKRLGSNKLGPWYVPKLPILIVQRLPLHQNGVEFRQQFNGTIRTSLTATYDVVRCHLEICYAGTQPRQLRLI